MTQIKRFRMATGLNSADVARKLHVSRAAVCKWESGSGMPTPKHLVQLAKLMGIEPMRLSYMLFPDPTQPQQQQSIQSMPPR